MRLGILVRVLAASLLFVAFAAPAAYARGDATTDAGEAIYRDGVTVSGKPLVAIREGGVRMEGKDAACINCHRRSGLGAREGLISIPPIAGRYLFHPRGAGAENDDLPFVENMRADRDPYTDATLARAIREGLDGTGKPLNYLMPHFALGDADMAALTGYLKRLGQAKPPGVGATVLHFATVVTPDADPVKVRGMLDVLEQYFADKNTLPLGATPRVRSSTRKMMYMVNRRWQLHVWQLSGPASGWQEQLEQRFAKEPVLAVVSGIGGRNWAPVHAFCEQRAVPCLFPNVEAPPPDAERGFYSLYFSRGVLLEAGLIANRILKPESGKAAKTVLQVYRAGDNGEAGAQALAAALERHGITVRKHVIPASAPQGLPAPAQVSGTDALVLWLRPPDVAALGEAPAAPVTVYMSGLMGGLERAPLPATWRERTFLAYPFALPEKRRIGVDFAMGWFRMRNVPIVAEQVQADTYLACGLLAETLKYMVDTFVPDYLVERIEDNIEHRIITGYYPRLALAQHQRFASKGGYIVHLPEPQGSRMLADSEWLVP